MPGSTPATSQLDWLSSTTAMMVLSWSNATRDLLKSFSWGIGALRQLFASDDGAISFAACPIPSLRWREMDSNRRYRGRRPASGRSLRAQRVETDAAKRVGSGSCLFAPPWGGSGGLGGGLCFPFPTPGNGQQESG